MSACLLCGSESATLLFTQTDRLFGSTTENFGVARCQKCGLVRLDPQPEAEELGRYYPTGYWFAPGGTVASRLEETYRRLVLRDHINFAAAALRSSSARGPVLDVGSGGGLFLGMLRQRGYLGMGLDISPEAASVAWARQGVPSLCAKLEECPLRPGLFACVTMFHVLEHLPDPRAYLLTARRLLQPDGRLVVQVPNAASFQFRALGKRWNGIDVPRHLYDFRECDLERLLESCGFEVVRRKHFSLRDNAAGLASSLAPRLDPMARRLRRIPEGGRTALLKDLVYFGLTMACQPLAALEAACHAGATIMMEARLK
jgi:SAM-dependent methyltransferase